MKEESQIKTYVDESGNSGKNLLDLKQPFFTIGAVLIDDVKLDFFKKYIEDLPGDIKDDNGEVKGNNIACYNQKIALEIISDLLPLNSEMFFFSVLEKKYMIAGQIVENYFDYVYNDKTDESWTYKSDKKIELANFFYDKLSSEAITNAHEAFLTLDIRDLEQSFNQILTEIEGEDYDFDVATVMRGAKNHLQSIADALKNVNAKHSMARGIPKNTIITPNVTTFFELIGRIEKYLSAHETNSILIFDNSEQYNKIFKEIMERMVNSPRQRVPISDDEYLQFGFKYLVDYKVDESSQSIGLQIVDFLTSIVNHIFSKVILKNDDNLTKEDILLTGIVYLLSTKAPSGYWTVSKKTIIRIGEIFSKINEI